MKNGVAQNASYIVMKLFRSTTMKLDSACDVALPLDSLPSHSQVFDSLH